MLLNQVVNRVIQSAFQRDRKHYEPDHMLAKGFRRLRGYDGNNGIRGLFLNGIQSIYPSTLLNYVTVYFLFTAIPDHTVTYAN